MGVDLAAVWEISVSQLPTLKQVVSSASDSSILAKILARMLAGDQASTVSSRDTAAYVKVDREKVASPSW
jgi:hypothetical protein